MESIRWFRSSGKRVTTPRRDKPKGPRDKKIPKRPSLGKPKAPGIIKPHVKIPFVQAGVKQGGQNLSVAGLNAVMLIAQKNGMTINDIVWEEEHGDGGGGHDCTETYFGSGEKICTALGRKGQGHWTGDRAMEDFQKTCAARYPISKGYGIWAASHINCKCKVHITMSSQDGRSATFVVSAYGDSSEPGGSDIGSGSDDSSVVSNIAAGYYIDMDNSQIKAFDGVNLKPLEGTMLSFIRKFHIGSQEEIDKFIIDNDVFGETVYVEQVRQVVAPETVAPAPAVEAPKVTAPEGIPLTEEELSMLPEDIQQQFRELYKAQEVEKPAPVPAEGEKPAAPAPEEQEEAAPIAPAPAEPAPEPHEPPSAVPEAEKKPEEEEEEEGPGGLPPAPGVKK